MKYPKMNKQPRRTVSVPSLQGGTNLRDALNMCQDNQLTDSLNMWFRDGVLRTRAGKITVSKWEHAATPDNAVLTFSGRKDKRNLHSDITRTIDGTTYTLVSFLSTFSKYKENDSEEKTNYSRLFLLWVTNDGSVIYGGDKLYFDDIITNYFITATPKGIYLFVSGDLTKEIYKYGGGWEKVLTEPYSYNENENKWIENMDIYIPILSTYGKYQPDCLANGENFESRSLLTQYYRIIYSTVNKELLSNDTEAHEMKYGLFSADDKDSMHTGYIVIAKLINENGVEYTHIATKTNELSSEYLEQEYDEATEEFRRIFNGGLSMAVSGGIVRFETTDENGNIVTAKVKKTQYVENNLTIIAPFFEYDFEKNKNLNKVFSMTQAEWFGGASQGINGGTRLFLGGSTDENEKSLIVWSGLNDPLYFPENCEAYVGNSMSAVKGFGKQEDMLVVFKENELYYTKYAQNDSITAENLINQSVVDYQASSVYFPLVQINPVIGCLSADSVKLCRNRLVWLGQDKKVYTLTGASQYSERNVFCVSEMIDRKLKSGTDLGSAYALDFDGHYMLIVGSRAYLMDYNSYGYQYVYSYQKTEDANIKIPWYIWEGISDKYSLLFNVNDKLCGITYKYATEQTFNSNNASKIELYAFDNDSDNGKPIISMAQTKFFDFGMPNHRKNIELVGVSLGNNGGEPITVRFITESGEDFTALSLYNDDTDSRNAGYIKSRILYPAIRSAVRFGVRFECEGNMAIEGLNISYRTLGGAR